MRSADIARLRERYPNLDDTSPGPGPAEALGVDAPTWRALEDLILADLTPGPPFGIYWWAPHPGTSRRILISDHLYACTHSVLDNLTEAGLHHLEFIDYADQESDRFANSLTFENGVPVVKAPRRTSPLEDAGIQLIRLHVAGVIRSLAGALDCVAGTAIGVLALPTKILRADFVGMREALRKIAAASSGTTGPAVQAEFCAKLDAAIDAAGPSGWLDWALTFRNMLVHRGRRIEVGQFVPRTPVIYGADGRPVPRVRVVTHLPLDPGRSDVEVFLEPSNPPVLTEDQHDTLSGLVASTRALVEQLGALLIEAWKWRQANAKELPQPAAQWPKGVSADATGFAGYAPGSFTYSPSMLMSHPVIGQRLTAAALDDRTRAQWKAFD